MNRVMGEKSETFETGDGSTVEECVEAAKVFLGVRDQHAKQGKKRPEENRLVLGRATKSRRTQGPKRGTVKEGGAKSAR